MKSGEGKGEAVLLAIWNRVGGGNRGQKTNLASCWSWPAKYILRGFYTLIDMVMVASELPEDNVKRMVDCILLDIYLYISIYIYIHFCILLSEVSFDLNIFIYSILLYRCICVDECIEIYYVYSDSFVCSWFEFSGCFYFMV